MSIQCLLMAFLFLTFTLTERAGEWMYFMWVCLMFGTFCGNFALFPTVTAKAFGQTYFIFNYGLVFSSQVWKWPEYSLSCHGSLHFSMSSCISLFSIFYLWYGTILACQQWRIKPNIMLTLCYVCFHFTVFFDETLR